MCSNCGYVFDTHDYDPYEIPDDWHPCVYTDDMDALKNDLFLIRRALRDVNTKPFILDSHGLPKVYDVKFIKRIG